ncbi:MAG: hypothetical protein DRO36_04455 [Candidatus Hecatellales archaeon]|nr:MAG: hypothetical protein DRO36_04455 [Candidatus Hecatellales archaeon]
MTTKIFVIKQKNLGRKKRKMENYDIVVVGAGPAGLMAARKAGEKNVRVLLVEKQSMLGVKACGEAVSTRTITDAEIQPSQKFISNKVKGAFIYAPDEKKRVEIFSEELGQGYILEKPAFLRELAYHAAKNNVDFWVNSEVLDVLKNGENYIVKVKKFGKILEVKTKIVLGCDGVNSTVAKKFFSREGYRLISCIQYRMVNCRFEDPHALECYLGREVAPLGYVWVFPKTENVGNVGIGVRGAPAKPYLDKFIEKHPEKFGKAKIVEVQAAPVPVSGQIEKIVDGGVMVCGDAAGQVIPLTGGGIHSSIVAGKVAGEVAAEFLGGKTKSLEEYPKRYTYWTKRIRDSLKALKVIEKLTDRELNQLADVLSGTDVVDLASGIDVRRVALKLLKHPYFALRITKSLLGE